MVAQKLVERIWYGNSRLALLLLPFAWLFAAVAGLRRLTYRWGWRAAPELPVPVVIVGNITAGGSGKTPVVIWLCQALVRAGYRPAIVSRGYGGTVRGEPHRVTAEDSPERVGDEPLLMHHATRLPVCVCSDRVRAVRLAAECGANVVVADDGLQHYALRRQVELIVVDGERLFGNGYRLPAGPLRESVSRLAEADAVLINGGDAALAGIRFELQPLAARRLASSDISRPLQEFAGTRVWAVAGIGNPGRFFLTLKAFGIVIDPVPLTDHAQTDLAELQRRRAQPVLMTEKDAVKYPDAEGDLWFVPVTVRFASSESDKLLSRIQDRLGPPGKLSGNTE
ncbi:MAG: tetraacyldisaccharide 4'-kinase [Gammaproteobacteria bacterium]|nr:tetraacyldisaccharide 4'-kinase [Gammaproteobacteria bacterium]